MRKVEITLKKVQISDGECWRDKEERFIDIPARYTFFIHKDIAAWIKESKRRPLLDEAIEMLEKEIGTKIEPYQLEENPFYQKRIDEIIEELKKEKNLYLVKFEATRIPGVIEDYTKVDKNYIEASTMKMVGGIKNIYVENVNEPPTIEDLKYV